MTELREHHHLHLGQAQVVFSTRRGGVSAGPYESLNLGILTDDDPAAVAENRGRLLLTAGLEDGAACWGLQVHGGGVREWEGALGPGPPPEADGHITSTPGLGLLVLAADCYPVALACPGRVALLHCGWRGVSLGIVERAVELLAADTAAAVGPGIGPCCYRVGDELRDVFGPDAMRGHALDLRRVIDQRLRAAGVRDVQHVEECTSCRGDLYFSHRRDRGVTGRQAGLAWLSG